MKRINLLNNETIEIENQRKIILNGLIYNENESENERENNIIKLEDLIKEKNKNKL